jgi:hypothetical protein
MTKIVCQQCCTRVEGVLNSVGSAIIAATKARGIM